MHIFTELFAEQALSGLCSPALAQMIRFRNLWLDHFRQGSQPRVRGALGWRWVLEVGIGCDRLPIRRGGGQRTTRCWSQVSTFQIYYPSIITYAIIQAMPPPQIFNCNQNRILTFKDNKKHPHIIPHYIIVLLFQMQTIGDPSAIPLKILTCSLCHHIFDRPITLSCGHTFCRQCLRKQANLSVKKSYTSNKIDNEEKAMHQLNICSICDCIIWRGQPTMRENLTIQNLIEKICPKPDRKASQDISPPSASASWVEQGYYNKILLRTSEPGELPMPSTYFEAQFITCFIEDIIHQSEGVVLTWPSLEKLGLGLLARVRKVESLRAAGNPLSKVVFDLADADGVLEGHYKGYFVGLDFVVLDLVQQLQINLLHKLIILGQNKPQKLIKTLQICSCTPKPNQASLTSELFVPFFSIYDNMNNPYYLHQLLTLIEDRSFQNRELPSVNRIYCVLKILKIPTSQLNRLVLCFDDRKRIDYVNEWLAINRNRMIDEIFRVKVPGKYNTGMVFFVVFLLLAFNLFRDFNFANFK